MPVGYRRPFVAERSASRTLAAACVAGALTLLLSATSPAVTFKPLEFETDAEREKYRGLTEELRCLVCQNQNLAESDAELAGDLRNEVYRMVRAGASDDEVVDFMVDRYGDFVLYRPPLRASTVLLWVGPFVLAGGGIVLLVGHLRRRNRVVRNDAPLSEAERTALERLVDHADSPRGD